MGLVATVAALLRRRRVERGTTALLFVLVAVSSMVVVAGPRWLATVADDGLRYEVAAATAIQRNLQFSAVGEIAAQTGDPLARVTARGDRIWDRLPASVQTIVGGRSTAIGSTRVNVDDPPNYTTLVDLAYETGIEDQVDYVEGRAPTLVVDTQSDAPPTFELALSTDTAAATLISVGDVLTARVDPADPLNRRVFPRPTTEVELRIVGMFAVRDEGSPFWYGESPLVRASVGGTEEFPIAYATMVFAPDAYQDLRRLGSPIAYRWRFGVEPARIEAGRLDELLPALGHLESDYSAAAGTPESLVYRSGLRSLVETFQTRRRTTEASLSVAAIGPLAVATGAVALVALIIVRRRRPALLLARGRGASSVQLLVAQACEGLLITVPAALLGLLIATTALAGHARSPGPDGAVIAALLVALLATALLVLATWPFARRARRDLEREEVAARRVSVRRLVIEATVVGVAIGAAWLLRERTVSGASIANADPGFDPFLAAAPVLIGIAVGLLAIRLYPIPVRVLAAAAARRRDLVPVLGLRNIGRHPSAAYLPLLILSLTVAVGVFSSVVAVTIERGQIASSWQAVGADHRIEAQPGSVLLPEADPTGIDGVEAVAAGLSIAVPPTTGTALSSTTTRLHALDPAAYEAVVAGSPGAVHLPAVFSRDVDPSRIGTEAAPIPAIVSSRTPNGWSPVDVGSIIQLRVRGQDIAFDVVDVIDTFPGLAAGSTFVVAPLAQVVAAHSDYRLRSNIVFVRGPAELGPRIHQWLQDTPVTEIERSRHASYAAVHEDPLVAAVASGFAAALVIAAAYAALAVMAVVALDAQRRSRELAFLRTLGLRERQMVALTVIEHTPPVVLAVGIGIVLGIGVAWLLQPGLGLAVFIEPGAPVVMSIDGGSILAVVLLVVAVIAVAIGLSSWLARRLSPADALRMGEA